MSLYVLCDTHLSTELDKPMDVFGGRWNGFEEKLRERWNSTVGDDDTVVVGGDISWAMMLDDAIEDIRFINALKGRKIFIRGNHDYWWESLKKMRQCFDENGFDTIEFLQNDSHLCGDIAVCGTRGWFADARQAPKGTDYAKISAREAQRLEMSLDHAAKNYPDARRVVFLHLPPVFGGEMCEPIAKVLEERGVEKCYYGHIHGVYAIPQSECVNGVLYTLASSDYLNFTPLMVK